MAGHTRSGVTLQTLDPKHFDHGVILDQTPEPGFQVPNPDSCSVPQLLEVVAPKAAQMLVNGIRSGLFVPPVEDAGWRAYKKQDPLIHAPKITTEHAHINWTDWTWADIIRRNRVLGPLWSKALAVSPSGEETLGKRVILTEIEEADPPKGCDAFDHMPGLPFVNAAHPVKAQQGMGLYAFTKDGKLIRIRKMKVEGEQTADAVQAALKAGMFSLRTTTSKSFGYTFFHDRLF